jgi:hypothetical protein
MTGESVAENDDVYARASHIIARCTIARPAFSMSWRLTIPIDAGSPPPRPQIAQRLSDACCNGLVTMRMGSAMVRLYDRHLTPARTGLILLVVLVLGAIVVRVITASEHSDVRTPTTHESVGRVSPDTGGVRGLRGSLP